MEINLKKLSEQEIKSTTNARKMKLSDDASSMVFQLFTKNVYSNPIGTVVREITSNCFDSHVEAGVNAPVVIRKSKDSEGNIHVSFIDFGVGMCPDRIYDIYGTYFESTKRVDNTQIGGFGIGGKTPLAYKRSTGMGEGEYDNSFYIITKFDGMEYTYLIYEGAESPIISELHKQKTKEHNGTEVRIPVLEKDVETFQKEMLKQLYYFENVVFEGFEYEHSYNKDENGNPEMVYPMSNDYQIIRGKSFLFRGDKYNSNMHICLGRVAYPIDFGTLGLESSDYRLPIALKLEVGDIGVTVSRESLDYSESTIKLLKKKLEESKQEIVELIGKQYKNIKTLEEYFQVKNDFGKLLFKNGSSLYVGNLIEQKDVDFSNFKYQFMKMPNDKQLFKFFFEPKMYGKKPSRSRYSSNSEFTGGYDSLKEKTNLFYIEDDFNRKIVKQAYLKDKFTTYYIINKRKVDSTWMKAEIADLFNVHLDDVVDTNGKPVTFIQSLLEMQEEYMEIVRANTQNYDTLEVPEDFVASRKRGAGITPELRKQTIPVKFIGGHSKDRVKLSVLFDYNMPIFYGTQDDQYELDRAMKIYGLLFNESGIVSHCDYNDNLITGSRRYRRDDDNKTPKSSIAFIMVATNNVKHLVHCKNARHISEFKLKMMYRKEDSVRQYFQMREAIEKFNQLTRFYRYGHLQKISDVWGAKQAEVASYILTMPKEAKDDSIQYHKSDLSRYINLDNIVPTKEQKDIMSKIDELLALQEKNEKTLSYFNIPSGAEDLEAEQIALLQLAMTF